MSDAQRLQQQISECLRNLISGTEVDFSKVRFETPLEQELLDSLAALTTRLAQSTSLNLESKRAEYILDGAGLGSWDWWLDSNQVHFDSRWCEMLGLHPKEAPQELSTWDTRVHPDDKAKAYEDIQAYLQGKTEVYENIHRMKHAQGHWVWILDRGRISEYDASGKALRFTGTHFNITEAKENELLSNLTQRIAGIGGWELDVKSGKTRWTYQTCLIHALDPRIPTDTIMGIEFFAPHERERIAQCVKESLQGHPYRENFEFIDAEGRHKWVEAIGEPVRDANGNVYKIIGTLRDVSQDVKRVLELEQAQESIRRANERMVSVLDHAPIVSYERTPGQGSDTSFMSPYILEVCGFPAEDFIQGRRSFSTIIHAEDLERVAQEIQRAVNGNQIYDLKYRIVPANGRTRIVQDKGRLSQKSGNLVGVLSDVTDQEGLSRDLKNIFDQSRDMLCIANFDGYFVRVSPSFSSVLGYSESELLSRPYAEFVVEDDQQKTQEQVSNNSAGGDTLDFENRYRCKNGDIKIMSWSARPDPREGLVYASVRDVTGQRNAEHKNQQILDSLNRLSIVSETDAEGKIIFANERFSAVSGYSADELIGKDHRIVNSGKHSKAFFKQIWETIRAGNQWSGQIENRAKDGRPFFVNTVITPIKDVVSDRILSYYSLRQDVSREVLEQKRLEEAERAGGLGSFILNLKSNRAAWSNGHNRIFGFSDEVTPSFDLVLERVHPDDRSALASLLQSIIQQGLTEYSIRYRILMPDGSLKNIESFGQVQLDSKGVPAQVTGVVLDVTKKVQSEAMLEGQRLQIIQTSKLASLGEMAAGIAHEINNPLAIISGSVSLLSKFADNPERLARKVEAVQKSCDRIARIVKGLQKFSRSGYRGDHQSHELRSIVQETIAMTEALGKRRGVSVGFDCRTHAKISCDEVEIEQVFINLITNALDAVEDHAEKWINIVLAEEDDSVVARVTDSGRGIPKEIQGRLFEPFFTTKAVGKGTGLGLSIIKGILDVHRAVISVVEDSPHTCFEIRFPKAGSRNHAS
jgi:PAS domain S-box-containing protein